MSHVFISYSRKDADFVEELGKKLVDAGFEIWIDAHIKTGDDWREEIDENIREAFALIVIMSPEAKTSEYVTYEWAFAYGYGVPLVPIMLRYTELHPRLGPWQHRDGSNLDDRFWQGLFKDLERFQTIYIPTQKEPLNPEELPVFVRDALGVLKNAETKAQAIGALEKLSINHPGARIELARLVNHENDLVRTQATLKLAEVSRYQDKSIIGYLEGILLSNNEDDILEATKALVRIGSVDSALHIIQAATTVSPKLRSKLLKEVVRLGDNIIPDLEYAIDNYEIGDVVLTLAPFGAKTVTKRMDLLDHNNRTIQSSAAKTFTITPDKRAAKKLREVFHKTRLHEALEALVETLGSDVKEDLIWAMRCYKDDPELVWKAADYARKLKLTDEIISELSDQFEDTTQIKNKRDAAEIIEHLFIEWEMFEVPFTEEPKFTPVLIEAREITSNWLKQNPK